MFLSQIYHELLLMKTNPNLPEPTFEETMSSKLQDTFNLVYGVLKLTKKIFML